ATCVPYPTLVRSAGVRALLPRHEHAGVHSGPAAGRFAPIDSAGHAGDVEPAADLAHRPQVNQLARPVARVVDRLAPLSRERELDDRSIDAHREQARHAAPGVEAADGHLE